MATAKGGRPSKPGATRKVPFTLPIEVDSMLERLSKLGFWGRSKSEVVVTLLAQDFERIVHKDLPRRLKKLAKGTA